jgi:hypothetical protein
MEIQSLKLVVNEDDANRLLTEFAPPDMEVENLRLRFTPEGVRVQGDTRALFFKVSFEALWEISTADGNVAARLNSMKVAGIQAGKLRGVLMKMVRDGVARVSGITVEDESVRVDVSEVLRSRGIPLRVVLTAVRCLEGSVVIEV